jgi:hypothetical protein
VKDFSTNIFKCDPVAMITTRVKPQDLSLCMLARARTYSHVFLLTFGPDFRPNIGCYLDSVTYQTSCQATLILTYCSCCHCETQVRILDILVLVSQGCPATPEFHLAQRVLASVLWPVTCVSRKRSTVIYDLFVGKQGHDVCPVPYDSQRLWM